ncbi:MAG: 5-formyltetrahydrofolate cyclo-ligase [Desulfobacterales bacterium]|nr:5-formyltetrahydrofolate cyclo-ligase [Desulfobacterales bacterium]
MEDVKDKKLILRKETRERIASFNSRELAQKQARIEEQLLEFANFQESEMVLFYLSRGVEIDLSRIIEACPRLGKEVVLPLFDHKKRTGCRLFKITSMETELKAASGHDFEPDPDQCKPVSFDNIDIALIPGIAFDEKGGRLGDGSGRYDRLIPLLPNTARKVGLALESQVYGALPMESHDKAVDIIITENRIIYKI